MKTADEMFRELGYNKNIEGDYANATDEIVISFNSPSRQILFTDNYGEICVLFEEILACAQLIKEMEEYE